MLSSRSQYRGTCTGPRQASTIRMLTWHLPKSHSVRSMQSLTLPLRPRNKAIHQQGHLPVVQLGLAEEVLDPHLVADVLGLLVQVLGHLAELYLAGFDEPQHETADKLLAGQVAHHLHVRKQFLKFYR